MLQPQPKIDIAQALKGFAGEFDSHLDRFLRPEAGVPDDLAQAVRYAALAPGKRVRPFLVVRCCELAGGSRELAWPAATAVECLHAFSLVHDDLPAMDDDDLRRGQPTTHKKFGEALGILAGDALVVRAFEIIGREYVSSLAASVVLELAGATGWAGMIGGQADDLAGQQKASSLELTRSIHVRKTGRLFAASCRIGAMVGGGASSIADQLGRFGLRLGEAFQIADDILDVTATAKELGKSPGKDAASDKQTYPRCVGVEESRAAASRAVAEALKELEGFGADDLRAMAKYASVRNY